jgi:conjugal transfer pilus assembly protein TraA
LSATTAIIGHFGASQKDGDQFIVHSEESIVNQITQTIKGALTGKHRQLTVNMMFIALLAVAMLAKVALAGTTGDEFEELYNLLLGWAEGFLARSIAIAASIIGALYGMAKQNPILALVGIVFAVILAIGPSVINGIVSAVI